MTLNLARIVESTGGVFYVSMCACVLACVCVNMCVCQWEHEKERGRMNMWIDIISDLVCGRGWERERQRDVRGRERERERERERSAFRVCVRERERERDSHDVNKYDFDSPK